MRVRAAALGNPRPLLKLSVTDEDIDSVESSVSNPVVEPDTPRGTFSLFSPRGGRTTTGCAAPHSMLPSSACPARVQRVSSACHVPVALLTAVAQCCSERSEHKNAGKEFLIRPNGIGGRDRWLAQLEEAIAQMAQK